MRVTATVIVPRAVMRRRLPVRILSRQSSPYLKSATTRLIALKAPHQYLTTVQRSQCTTMRMNMAARIGMKPLSTMTPAWKLPPLAGV